MHLGQSCSTLEGFNIVFHFHDMFDHTNELLLATIALLTKIAHRLMMGAMESLKITTLTLYTLIDRCKCYILNKHPHVHIYACAWTPVRLTPTQCCAPALTLRQLYTAPPTHAFYFRQFLSIPPRSALAGGAVIYNDLVLLLNAPSHSVPCSS